MSTITKKEFIREYLKAINENYAAVFAGAGLSRSAGYVDWKELLSDLAEDIGLDIKKETDLVAVAQYYKNERGGRSAINQIIMDKFNEKVENNINIQILSELPICTYWTTNYDSLIEQQLKKQNKRVDVKVNQNNLSLSLRNRDVVVYKMHEDISDPSSAVLTKDDYEAYNIYRSLFSTALQGDLISKTFVFIGFSFEDPNLNSILSRIRVLLNDNQRSHYCLLKKITRNDYNTDEDYIYASTKQKLRIEDLLRYSINTVLIDSYDEITEILLSLKNKYFSRRLFMSGSAYEYGQWDSAPQFLTLLSQTLVKYNYHIITGFGNGVGSFIISGSLDEIMNNKSKNVERYLTMRPRPSFDLQTDKGRILQKHYHEDMIGQSGVVIFLFGNKKINNDVINSNGVIEEFEIAKSLNKYVIPIGATGYAAKLIYDEVYSNMEKYKYLKPYMNELLNCASNTQMINTILNILNDINEIKQ